jgi:hypothetical protein
LRGIRRGEREEYETFQKVYLKCQILVEKASYKAAVGHAAVAEANVWRLAGVEAVGHRPQFVVDIAEDRVVEEEETEDFTDRSGADAVEHVAKDARDCLKSSLPVKAQHSHFLCMQADFAGQPRRRKRPSSRCHCYAGGRRSICQ